jgi:hypothetical protein
MTSKLSCELRFVGKVSFREYLSDLKMSLNSNILACFLHIICLQSCPSTYSCARFSMSAFWCQVHRAQRYAYADSIVEERFRRTFASQWHLLTFGVGHLAISEGYKIKVDHISKEEWVCKILSDKASYDHVWSCRRGDQSLMPFPNKWLRSRSQR